MKQKKLLSLVLATAMVTMMLSGCGKTAEEAKTDAPAKTEEKTETEEVIDKQESNPFEDHVTITLYHHGSNVTDDAAVMEKINEYLGEKINAELKVIWGTWGDFDEGSVMAINGGDDVDIYFTCSWSADEYNKYAKQGAWVRLDDPDNNILAAYGSDVWAALPEVLKEGAAVDGAMGYGVYAVPAFKDFGTQNTWDVNVTLLEELGYSLSDIEGKTFYDFGDILAAAKKAKGDKFYPLVIEGAVLERMVTNSIIVSCDTAGVLSYYLDPKDVSNDIGSKIVNKFGTDEYAKFANQVREYYLAGYIDPALANGATANDTLVAQQNAAEYLIGTQSYALGYEYSTSASRGIHVEYVPCTDPYVDKTATQGAMMAVSTASKNPERAMAFLNLLNTDPYLMQLLAYGVEGIHYQVNDDGLLVREVKDEDGNIIENYHENYNPWRNGLGNITLLTPTVDEGANFFTDSFIPYYTNAKGIPAFGFSFNVSEELDTVFAALQNVQAQYALTIDCGAVDPATALPEFLAKLDDAGIQKVLDEANAQLDAYFAAN